MLGFAVYTFFFFFWIGMQAYLTRPLSQGYPVGLNGPRDGEYQSLDQSPCSHTNAPQMYPQVWTRVGGGERVEGWPSSHLFFDGSLFILAQAVTKALEKRCRVFLWKGHKWHKKIIHMSKEEICCEKNHGGLSARDRNLAYGIMLQKRKHFGTLVRSLIPFG